jgi:putative aldouronate transport system permease protein
VTGKEMFNLRRGKRKNHSGMVEEISPLSIMVDILFIIILLLVAFASVIPLWHVLMASLSDGQLLFAHSGLVTLPIGKLNLAGFKLVLQNNSILLGYINSIIYVVGNVAFGFVLNVIGGYVLSRKTKLRSALRLFVVFTILFSGGVVPLYMVVRSLGMVGTRWSLIIPHCTNAAFMVMMIKAFENVPEETLEAARMDGAGDLRIMFQIALPQCFNFALVTMVNTGIIAWNAWFSASIYVPTNKDRWPVQLWIRDLVAVNQDFLNWTNPDYSRYLVQYSVVVLATFPLLMMFPLFIRRLEKGMALGAVKG